MTSTPTLRRCRNMAAGYRHRRGSGHEETTSRPEQKAHVPGTHTSTRNRRRRTQPRTHPTRHLTAHRRARAHHRRRTPARRRRAGEGTVALGRAVERRDPNRSRRDGGARARVQRRLQAGARGAGRERGERGKQDGVGSARTRGRAPEADRHGRRTADVRLLPKESRPVQCRHLRPITVLPASAKGYSKALLHAVSPYDVRVDECMLGFRRGCQCAALISVARLSIERYLEWQTPMSLAQVDFGKASECAAAAYRTCWRRRISERCGPRPCVSSTGRGRWRQYNRSSACVRGAACPP